MAHKPDAFRWLRLTEELQAVPSLEQRCAALAVRGSRPPEGKSVDKVDGVDGVDGVDVANDASDSGGDGAPKLKAA